VKTNTQLLPSAKLGVADKKENNTWINYYAGYSRTYVRSAFELLGITPAHRILDPWSGSGTTGLVAQQLGFQSISIEINPVIAYLAGGHFAIKSLPKKRVQKIIALLEELVLTLHRSNQDSVSGGMVLNHIQKYLPFANYRAKKGDIRLNEISPDFSLTISIVLLAYKKVADYRSTKNPSWTSHVGSNVDKNNLCNSLQNQITLIETMMSEARECPTAKQVIGDARGLLFQSDSIDAIVTSPPYLTRIDYEKTTAAETIWLFGEQKLRLARENNMGAPVIRRIPASTRWPSASMIADVISAVETHMSYAAQNYYLKTFRQYFDDMYLSLAEIHRVLRPGGVALLVVQNSYFKEIEIPLGELYVDLWNRCFGSGEIAARHKTTNSMVQINQRAVSSRMTMHLHEDTVALYK
jgi:DNA modification methylase